MYTAESDVAPHFLNGRKGIYVRTDEFSARFESRMANENELRHLFDRRRLIRERRARLSERAKKRFDTYAAKTHTDRSGNRTKLGSRLELCFVPRFPARPLCEQESLKPLVMGNSIPWRGTIFPKLTNGIVFQHESAIILQAATDFSIFEANLWGMLFYGTEIDSNAINGTLGIHLYHLVGCVLVFIRHADKMLQALGYSGPILIESGLFSILGVQLLYSQNESWLSTRPGSELDDDVAFSITTTSEALHDKPDGVAMDVLRYIIFSLNWPDLIATPWNLEDLVRKGYTYNSWPQPGNVQI